MDNWEYVFNSYISIVFLLTRIRSNHIVLYLIKIKWPVSISSSASHVKCIEWMDDRPVNFDAQLQQSLEHMNLCGRS